MDDDTVRDITIRTPCNFPIILKIKPNIKQNLMQVVIDVKYGPQNTNFKKNTT